MRTNWRLDICKKDFKSAREGTKLHWDPSLISRHLPLPHLTPRRFNRERRARRRYSISENVSYLIRCEREVLHRGTGHILNLSSSGILFESEEPLPVGEKVELSIPWPALLNGEIALSLRTIGTIVRANRRHTAATIDKYEFFTAKHAAVAASGPAPARSLQ